MEMSTESIFLKMEKVVAFYADDSKEVFFMTNYICILKKL